MDYNWLHAIPLDENSRYGFVTRPFLSEQHEATWTVATDGRHMVGIRGAVLDGAEKDEEGARLTAQFFGWPDESYDRINFEPLREFVGQLPDKTECPSCAHQWWDVETRNAYFGGLLFDLNLMAKAVWHLRAKTCRLYLRADFQEMRIIPNKANPEWTYIIKVMTYDADDRPDYATAPIESWRIGA